MPKSVIEVNSVSKMFHLSSGTSSLKQKFTSLFHTNRRKKTTIDILQDLTFKVVEGEFLGIVGRNGSGKSTLLKLLAGIYQPTHGTIKVCGKLVPFIELGVGFNPELTGRENIYLNGALLGFSKKEIDAKYKDIVDFAELEDFMDQKLKNYSSGMQVRLAFSLAIRADAQILLIDEVLAVGDADFQKKCFDYFFELKKLKKTVIFISHDMDAIKTYCDRVIVLESGKIIHQGGVSKATEEYFKLFQHGNVNVSTGQKGKRWGDGSVKIQKYTIKEIGGQIVLNVMAEIMQPVSNVNFGFSIKDQTDNIIFGTNTEHLRQKLNSLHTGQKIISVWTIPDIFREGKYTVDIAAHGKSGLPVYDWIDNALTYSCKNGRRTPYVIAPEIKIELTVE